MIWSSMILYSLYKIANYLYNVCVQYENYFDYLKVLPDTDYVPGNLEAGMWISRSMERGYINLQPLIYTQHHGVMVNSNTVAHFQDNQIKLSSLKEYMGDEKIINVYKKRDNFEWPDEEASKWDGKYNLIYNNCEHFASSMVEGYARSRQIEVLEHLVYHYLLGKGYPPDSLKIIPIARYRYFNFRNQQEYRPPELIEMTVNEISNKIDHDLENSCSDILPEDEISYPSINEIVSSFNDDISNNMM